jgi:Ni/Fe-hydrogenase subunit HybB-like protein
VVIESAFSAWGFGRPRETAMLQRLGKVALWVTLFWTVFRVAEVAVAGKLAYIGRGNRSWFFVAEVLIHVAAIAMLASPKWRARADMQVRAAILLVAAGTLFRVNTYLVAFRPGANWAYFPALPEVAITVGIFSLEVAIYLWAVRRFPILAAPQPAASH